MLLIQLSNEMDSHLDVFLLCPRLERRCRRMTSCSSTPHTCRPSYFVSSTNNKHFTCLNVIITLGDHDGTWEIITSCIINLNCWTWETREWWNVSSHLLLLCFLPLFVFVFNIILYTTSKKMEEQAKTITNLP